MIWVWTVIMWWNALKGKWWYCCWCGSLIVINVGVFDLYWIYQVLSLGKCFLGIWVVLISGETPLSHCSVEFLTHRKNELKDRPLLGPWTWGYLNFHRYQKEYCTFPLPHYWQMENNQTKALKLNRVSHWIYKGENNIIWNSQLLKRGFPSH